MKKKPKKQSTEKAVEKGTGKLARTIKKTRPTAKGKKKQATAKVTKVIKQDKKKKPSRKELTALKVHARREKVRQLILEGKNGTAIARILEVSRKTIVDDLRILREEVMGFIESNEEFLTNMATHHDQIGQELDKILKEECITFKGGEEQPSAFLKIECLKTKLTSNKDFAELLFKLGKIKEAPKKVEGQIKLGWQEYTEPDKPKDKKES